MEYIGCFNLFGLASTTICLWVEYEFSIVAAPMQPRTDAIILKPLDFTSSGYPTVLFFYCHLTIIVQDKCND